MTIVLILGMGLITFLFRFTPLLLVRKTDIEERKNWFLENLPLAVLSALIIPGIFQVDNETPMVGVSAGIVAIVLVLLKKVPLFGVIIASVSVAVLVKIL
ncbi:AzlD domain-containing protein [Paenibacillus sp. HN-1]|uniref:AzlD domain-containing protein n=1 Tax=Paenibacillus TaxID=44249 RepID=UPI001CA8709C|nr:MULTISPECIES: AzlD domain-containing protein [Paenibacillus]MBY9080591.1 AzlD domain-containing protein [Paenibacillus sp. CGMCC 1.18879]MBY9085464.1 AzlD domain-containing protein [Paenibacillus sinensis]